MITTQAELRKMFWEQHEQYRTERRAGKTQNDYRADVRVAWCNFVDCLHRDGQIGEKLADRATL